MKKILISFVVACELMLTAYSANKFVPLRTNTVFSGAFSVKGKHPKVKNPSMFLANSSAKLIDAVAEVDGYSYSSIQDAIAAAVGHGTAQVDIIKNASLDKPLSIIGKSIDETNIKLNINQDVVVTFTNREIPGIMIDNATVEFIGDGTWFKLSNDPHYPTKTMVCVGERAIDCKLAPARVVVTSGTFDCGHSNVFKVKTARLSSTVEYLRFIRETHAIVLSLSLQMSKTAWETLFPMVTPTSKSTAERSSR